MDAKRLNEVLNQKGQAQSTKKRPRTNDEKRLKSSRSEELFRRILSIIQPLSDTIQSPDNRMNDLDARLTSMNSTIHTVIEQQQKESTTRSASRYASVDRLRTNNMRPRALKVSKTRQAARRLCRQRHLLEMWLAAIDMMWWKSRCGEFVRWTVETSSWFRFKNK